MTWPTVRDDFAEANNGTAIVEEADSNGKISSSEFEALLSERYSRNTALAKLKVPKGEYNWVTQERPYFGATVIHRRIPFADAALDGRAIAIRSLPNYSRTYGEFDPEDATNQQVKTLARILDLSLTGYRVPPGLPVGSQTHGVRFWPSPIYSAIKSSLTTSWPSTLPAQQRS